MGTSIHIIEDDPAVRDSLFELLTGDGHAVVAHDSPEAFFNAPEPDPLDVIILDIHFPDGSGIEVAKQVKHAFPDIKIVVISGLRTGMLARALVSIEPVATFRKPVDGTALTSYMRRLVATNT